MKATKQKILEFIVAYIQKHSYPPTVREIGEGVGLKSTSSVQSHIVRMLDCGMLETDSEPGSTRAIRVPGYKFVKEEADGWIPVEERLPNKEEYLKDDGRFMLDDGNRRYQGLFDIYDGKFKFTKHISGLHYELFEDNCVIAWQPLPESYHSGVERKKTNADRIRSMSDKELAKEIAEKIECTTCPFVNEEGKCGEVECEKLFLEWLQSEVE